MIHRDRIQRFGFTLSAECRDEASTRHVAAVLNQLGSLDERRPEERFACTCRDFAVLLWGMLREAGDPACAQAGFTDGLFDDHCVVDFWNAACGWHLVDAQVASAPPGAYTYVDIYPLDVDRTPSSPVDRPGRNAAPAAAI